MKMPPIEKIPEAYSAIADHRVSLCENSAIVRSSDGKKEYKVKWNDEGVYYSTDSASFWQGYPGYPVIAVLMLQHKLPLDYEAASVFKGIKWHDLNEKYKRNYAAAFEEVMAETEAGVELQEKAYKEIDKVYEELKKMNLKVKRFY